MKTLLERCINLLDKNEALVESNGHTSNYLRSNNYFQQITRVLQDPQTIAAAWIFTKNNEKLFEFQTLFLQSNLYIAVFLHGLPSAELKIKKLYEDLIELELKVVEKIKEMGSINYLDHMLSTKPRSLKSKFYMYIHNKINTLPLMPDDKNMRQDSIILRSILNDGGYNQRYISGYEEYCYIALYILIVRQLRYLSAQMESKSLLGHLKVGTIGVGALTGLGLATRYFMGRKTPVINEPEEQEQSDAPNEEHE